MILRNQTGRSVFGTKVIHRQPDRTDDRGVPLIKVDGEHPDDAYRCVAELLLSLVDDQKHSSTRGLHDGRVGSSSHSSTEKKNLKKPTMNKQGTGTLRSIDT